MNDKPGPKGSPLTALTSKCQFWLILCLITSSLFSFALIKLTFDPNLIYLMQELLTRPERQLPGNFIPTVIPPTPTTTPAGLQEEIP